MLRLENLRGPGPSSINRRIDLLREMQELVPSFTYSRFTRGRPGIFLVDWGEGGMELIGEQVEYFAAGYLVGMCDTAAALTFVEFTRARPCLFTATFGAAKIGLFGDQIGHFTAGYLAGNRDPAATHTGLLPRALDNCPTLKSVFGRDTAAI